MLDIPALALRILVARWPALLALFLAGWLGRQVLIELAGFAGSFSTIAGFLLLPLAVLAKLLSLVAMVLVVRSELPGYRAVLDSGLGAVEGGRGDRRRTVVDVTLASILPFFLFYAAWQFIRDDVQDYADIALGYRTSRIFDDVPLGGEAVLELSATPLSIGVIVAAYVIRFALKRAAGRLPRWTSLVAVYCEAVWVYFFLFLTSDLLGIGRDWIASRQGMVWIEDARERLGETVAPLAWAWDAVLALVGQLGDVLLLPLAWLAIAGVVLGRALTRAAPTLRFRSQRLRVARERFDSLPAQVLRRLRDIGADLVSRFRPVADALALIWRAGPITLGVFVLAYSLVDAAGGWTLRGLAVAIGPVDGAAAFVLDEPLILAASAVWEPVRIAIVVAAYDVCLRRLDERRARDEAVLSPPPAPAAP